MGAGSPGRPSTGFIALRECYPRGVSLSTRCAGVVALVLLIGLGCGREAKGRARNVLLVSIDTCRADRLGCYGESLPTSPHLDRLAAGAALFLQASSTNSVTLPAHSSIMLPETTDP